MALLPAPWAWCVEPDPAGLSVVMDDNYPPFSFRDGEGRLQGILIDQWRLFEGATGVRVAIRAMDWGEALERMRGGEFDVIDTIFATEERSRWLDFTPPYAQLDVTIFFDREIAGITDAASLRGFPVAVKTGDAAIDLLRGKGVGNLILYRSYEAIVQAAKERKVAVFVIDQPPAIYLLARQGILDRFRSTAPLGTGAFHRAVRHGNAALLERLEQGFARITPQELQAIERRWRGSAHDQDPLRTPFIVVGALALVLVLLAIWNRSLIRTAARARGDSDDIRRRVFDSSPIPIVVMDPETGRYLDCNPAATAIYRHATREETLGRTPWEVSAPVQYDGTPSAELAAHYMQRALAEGAVVFDWLHQRPDGGCWDAEVHLMSFAIGGRRYLQFSLIDITERKRSLADRVAAQRFADALIDGMPGIFYLCDHDLRLRRWNRNHQTELGWSAAELDGRHIGAGLARDGTRQMAIAGIQAVMRDGGTAFLEEPLRHQDGRAIPYLLSATRIETGDGAMMFGFGIDISTRVRAEEDLRRSQALLQGVIDGTDDCIFVKDADGACILHNQALRRFMIQLLGPGFPADGLLGKRDRDYLPAAVADRLAADEAGIRRSGEPQDIEETFPLGGQLRTFQTRKFLFPFPSAVGTAQGILGVARDITGRKQAEEALRESEARFRAMFTGARDGILITEVATLRFRYANPAICRLLGWSEEQLLAVGVDAIHPPEDLPRLKGIFARQLAGEVVQAAETPVLCRDGTVRYCDISAQPIEIHGVPCRMAVFRDMTESRQVAERLRQAEKLQAVGQLAAGVAHDFNNMLAGILGAAELMERRMPAESPMHRQLAMITQAAGRAGGLTSKLLAFARRSKAELVPVDLHQVLRDTIALLATTIDRRIAIVQDLQAAESWTAGDAAQLQNVLLNLGINAAQAMPEGGTLTFVTRNLVSSAIPGLGPGPHLAIEVSDTGCGIPAEHLPRIFEPFFTTKAPGQGTGLGLAVVFGTVQQHHGAIEVRSTVGVGTCFRVLLPLCAGQDLALAATSAPATGSGLILVVDDEPILREMLASTLEDLGYRVLLAQDGRQALDLFVARRAAIDLVILDQIMPEMNGRDCFAALRRIAPDLRVILLSGFIHEDDLARMLADGLSSHLRKPFHIEELARAVRQALGEAVPRPP